MDFVSAIRMGERTFKFSILALLALMLLSTTEFPGGMIGFFVTLAVAFFVAGPSFLLAAALQKVGIPASDKTLPIILIGLYVTLILIAAVGVWRAWGVSKSDDVRLRIFRVALLAALPIIAWTSLHSMARAWH